MGLCACLETSPIYMCKLLLFSGPVFRVAFFPFVTEYARDVFPTSVLSYAPPLETRLRREWCKSRNEAIFKMEAGTKHGFNLRAAGGVSEEGKGDVKGE